METILQHYSSEEREFVEKGMDLCRQVQESYTYRLTPFLNPRQRAILQDLANHYALQLFSSEMLLETEYARVLLAPDYYVLDTADFEIAFLNLLYPTKFYRLTHAQIMGTLLHHLGVKREVLGDILVDDTDILVCLDRKFLPLVKEQVQKIARVPVQWREVEEVNWEKKQGRQGELLSLLFPSLRLDNLIAVTFRLPRSTAVKLIQSGRVKCNYSTLQQPSAMVGIGQLISVRGYGRIRLIGQNGLSKRGKLKVDLEVIRKKS
ncbi:YlmH family RNA-binding protein [Streptococcus sp. DD13]|uniref:YlmH family RNA-binding protein n=1 Tax=Streptococcus sp. DD13 TaxID=1777881 RepID=UPI000796F158|nr:YlmH/Sll1252 family protein [Streptococcus sp. DD13]KXT79291.1 hypothetical protein STRDD13_00049 [Streptococcus sp. DD13]